MEELHYLDLHGERVAYHDVGDGPVILLIHGMAGSSRTWRAVLPKLSTHYRVVAPDLIGHGHSAKPRGDYSLGAFAVWLRDLLDALDIQHATIVGQSLGGGIAMQFVHQHPDYCDRLILIGSGGLGPEVGWTLRLLAAPGSEFVLPLIAPQKVVDAGNWVRAKLTRLGFRNDAAEETWRAYCSLSEHDARQAFLRTLNAVVDRRGQSVSAMSKLHFVGSLPVMLVWGERDRIIPVEHAYAAHAAMPESRLVTVPEAGHYPHVETPDLVAGKIADFIETTRPWQWQRKASPLGPDALRC